MKKCNYEGIDYDKKIVSGSFGFDNFIDFQKKIDRLYSVYFAITEIKVSDNRTEGVGTFVDRLIASYLNMGKDLKELNQFLESKEYLMLSAENRAILNRQKQFFESSLVLNELVNSINNSFKK